MKTRFRFAAVLLFALAGAMAHQAAHAYALFLQTAANPVNVTVGNTFTVKVQLDNPASLASYDFSLGFDKALVSLIGASAPTFAANFTSAIKNNEGVGTFSSNDLNGLDASATGPITLVEVAFQALAEGSSTVSVLDDPLDVSKQPGLGFNAAVDTARPDVSDARVDVRITGRTVRVPEPASLALVGVAIAAIGVGAARRRAAA